MEQNRIELFCFGKDVEEMTAQVEKVEKKAPEVGEHFGVAGIFERAGVTPADKAQSENRQAKEEVAPWVDEYAEVDPWDNRPLEVVLGEAPEPMGKAIRVDGPISRAEAKKQIRRQYMGKVASAVFEENFKALVVPVFFFLGAFLLFPGLGQWVLSSDVLSNGLMRRQISEYTPSEVEVMLFSWLYLFVLLTLVFLLAAQVKIARRWKAARRAYKAEKY